MKVICFSKFIPIALLTLSAVKVAHAQTVSLTSSSPSTEKQITLSTIQVAQDLSALQIVKNGDVPYENVWADLHGKTHISKCMLTGLQMHGYAPPAAPYLMGFAPEDIKRIVVSILPVGWYGQWHHAPGPQWVIDLSGSWEVKTSDGNVLRQGPGQMQFNSDASAHAEVAGSPVGHTARQVGNVPDVRMIITLKPRAGQRYEDTPCVI